MTDASRNLSFGIPAMFGAGRSEIADAGSRAQETNAGWRYVTLAFAGKEDGCWFKRDGSQDWQRIENQKQVRRLIEPLVDDRGHDGPGLRSVSKKHRSGIWLAAKTFIGIFILALAVFGAIHRDAIMKRALEISGLQPNGQFSADIEDGLANAVRSMRANLPKRIDQMTTLMWVSYSGTKMVYDNRLEIDGSKLDDSVKKKLTQLITVNTCTSPASRKLIDLGGSYRYVYSDVQAKILLTIEVDKSKCS